MIRQQVDPARRRLLSRAAGLGACAAAAPALEAEAAAPAAPADEAFEFALIGDLPYLPFETGMLRRVFASLDSTIRFVIHVGDLKGGTDRCDDEKLASRAALLDESPVALLYTPGDNEWTDCSRITAGGYDPLERLQWLRKRFFSQPLPLGRNPQAFARKSLLVRQSDGAAGGLPENLQWRIGRTRFVSVNLPGSNNGLASARNSRREMAERGLHNERWLEDAFDRARRDAAPAVFVVAHANPRFDRERSGAGRASGGEDGFREFRATLLRLSEGFAGQTVLLHGDTHRHEVERLAPRLLRVECHGSPYSDRWVRIGVRPGAQPVVSIRSVSVDPAPPLS